jgi:hypothetical protein
MGYNKLTNDMLAVFLFGDRGEVAVTVSSHEAVVV